MDYITTSEILRIFPKLSREEIALGLKNKVIKFENLNLNLKIVNTRVTDDSIVVMYRFFLDDLEDLSKPRFEDIIDSNHLHNFVTSLSRSAQEYRKDPILYDRNS